MDRSENLQLWLKFSLLVIATALMQWFLGILSIEVINDSSLHSLADSIGLWNRWDTPHYLDLAQHGYSNHGELGLFIVFFPAFPAMVRVLTWLVGDAHIAALLLSNLALVAACVALYRITEHYRGRAVADRSVWYLLIFPSSFALHIGYTESLFMAALLWLWLGMLRQQWLLVGGLGLLLTATRINGSLIGFVVAFVILQQWWQSRRFDPRWLWTALLPLGLGCYLLINFFLYDNPLHFLEVQRGHWHKSPGTPISALMDLWQRLDWNKRDFWFMGVFELAAIALGLLASVYAFARLSIAAGLWSAGNLLLMTSTGWALSLPRYVIAIFPLFILMGEISHRRSVERLLDFACISLFALCAMEFAHGHWAF